MMIDKAEIKEMAARLGAPMTGIAPIHRFTCDGDGSNDLVFSNPYRRCTRFDFGKGRS